MYQVLMDQFKKVTLESPFCRATHNIKEKTRLSQLYSKRLRRDTVDMIIISFPLSLQKTFDYTMVRYLRIDRKTPVSR